MSVPRSVFSTLGRGWSASGGAQRVAIAATLSLTLAGLGGWGALWVRDGSEVRRTSDAGASDPPHAATFNAPALATSIPSGHIGPLQVRKDLETYLAVQAADLLAPVLGEGRFTVRVNADVDSAGVAARRLSVTVALDANATAMRDAIQRLVTAGLGLRADRGDVLEVVTVPFSPAASAARASSLDGSRWPVSPWVAGAAAAVVLLFVQLMQFWSRGARRSKASSRPVQDDFDREPRSSPRAVTEWARTEPEAAAALLRLFVRRKGPSEEAASWRQAAIVLAGLGPQAGGAVLRVLDEELIERIVREVARLGWIHPSERLRAFDELEHFRTESDRAVRGGRDVAADLLQEALGAHRARKMLRQATEFADRSRFAALSRLDPATAANLLGGESAQTAALVLAHLDPRRAGPVLAALPRGAQAEIAYRMSVLESPHPEMVDALEAELEAEIAADFGPTGEEHGGSQQVAELLNHVDQQTWTAILEEMRDIHEDTADEVKNLMFVFEDIVTLDDRYVQDLLKEIDSRELTYALKAATDEVKQKIFANMSRRAGAGIQEDMEYLGPVRRSEVVEAQQRIIDTIRRLERDGVIVLGKEGTASELVV